MATKTEKKVAPKGQRLGWTAIKDAEPVSLRVVTINGKRAVLKAAQESSSAGSFLIP